MSCPAPLGREGPAQDPEEVVRMVSSFPSSLCGGGAGLETPRLPLIQLLPLGKSLFLFPKPKPTSQLNPEKADSICRPRDYIDLQCWYPGGHGCLPLSLELLFCHLQLRQEQSSPPPPPSSCIPPPPATPCLMAYPLSAGLRSHLSCLRRLSLRPSVQTYPFTQLKCR